MWHAVSLHIGQVRVNNISCPFFPFSRVAEGTARAKGFVSLEGAKRTMAAYIVPTLDPTRGTNGFLHSGVWRSRRIGRSIESRDVAAILWPSNSPRCCLPAFST